MVFKENSDKKLAKFQPNGFRDCRLGVKNKYSTFRNFLFEKKKKRTKRTKQTSAMTGPHIVPHEDRYYITRCYLNYTYKSEH